VPIERDPDRVRELAEERSDENTSLRLKAERRERGTDWRG
jgi:hypothetical protein